MAVKAEGTALRRRIMHATAIKKSNLDSLLFTRRPDPSKVTRLCRLCIAFEREIDFCYVLMHMYNNLGLAEEEELPIATLNRVNNKVEGACQSSISREQGEHMDLLISMLGC